MRKSFKLQDLDCANCASKMEHDISNLAGVNSASISFMTSKLVIDAAPEELDHVLEEAQAICTRYEKDCVIVR